MRHNTIMDLSWMQLHILEHLTRVHTATLKSLTPDGIPANQFSYHLTTLIAEGFVKKEARGVYTLTPAGEKFVGSFSTKTRRLVKDVKTVIMFYGKKDGQYLLFRWSRQPYLGQVTLPHDRVAYDTSLETAVTHACNEKLGKAIETKYKTTAIVKIYHDEMLISSMTALVFEVDIDWLALPFISRNGEAFLGEVANVGGMQGVEGLLAALDSGVLMPEVMLRY